VKAPLPRLHAVTDERIARRPDLSGIAAALAAGGDAHLAFHARGRALGGRALHDLAVRLSAFAPARLFVNERLDVALVTGAAGVQLPAHGLAPADARRLGPEWWIGCSVHTLAEARSAGDEGADYLVVGPVCSTASHPGIAPLALDEVRAIARLGLPVIAIGGITPDRVPPLVAAGVYGVAAIRALWDADDPARAAGRLLEAMS
jgi:thiamine-phosphate diphosphorylase